MEHKPEPLEIPPEIDAIRSALLREGYPPLRHLPGRLAWRLKLPAWTYTLTYTPASGWQLQPVNTSPRYFQLMRIITKAATGDRLDG